MYLTSIANLSCTNNTRTINDLKAEMLEKHKIYGGKACTNTIVKFPKDVCNCH